ncbi:MAG: 23S rRNA (guanosine(2251)-2'-O)-methyltransferase RlmB [Candidatus Nanopelagicales bacterium]
MAGNSQRKGAMRKEGTKKGMTVGSGGQRRKALKGKGPTPKAEERAKHPAARRARAVEKQAAKRAPAARARKDGREVLVGRNPVVEALRAGVPASALYVQQYVDTDDRVREALTIAADTGMPLLEVTRIELDRMSGGAAHQGLLLTVPAYDYLDPNDLLERAIDSGTPALIVALDGVTDPRNLGAIVRSAAAFGADGVVVPERRAAGVTGSAWKASAGTLAHLPVARATNLTRALTAYRKAGCTVIGLAADGDMELTALPREIADAPLVLVIGGEGRGLGRLVSETCDHTVSIPMATSTESLNAAVAAGVALYAVASLRSSS